MKIVSISEDQSIEKRVAITPDIAKKYISLGLEVHLSKNYAEHLGFKDSDYEEVGVRINDNDDELIIANCDQIMEWNSKNFLHNIKLYDGAMVTYHSDTKKNSYASVDQEGFVTAVKEKEVISNISLNGIHYWKKGKYFIESAQEMINSQDRANNGEFYIGPTYNYMIKKGLKVGIHHIPNQQHHPIGVPEDLKKYIEYVNKKT